MKGKLPGKLERGAGVMGFTMDIGEVADGVLVFCVQAARTNKVPRNNQRNLFISFLSQLKSCQ
jgi:hypothetical protein